MQIYECKSFFLIISSDIVMHLTEPNGGEDSENEVEAHHIYFGEVVRWDVLGGKQGVELLGRPGSGGYAPESAGEKVHGEEHDGEETKDLEKVLPQHDGSVVLHNAEKLDELEQAEHLEEAEDLDHAQQPRLSQARRVAHSAARYARVLVNDEIENREGDARGRVEPKAEGGLEVGAGDERGAVDVDLVLPQEADEELQQDLRQEEGVDEDVELQRREPVAGVVVGPHADLDGGHDGRVEQQQPADENLALHEGRQRMDEPAAVLPHPAIACADAEGVLQPAHGLAGGGAAQHRLLEPLLEALAVPPRVRARRAAAVLLVPWTLVGDRLLALDIGELVLNAEKMLLHPSLLALDIGELILHSENPVLQVQKELTDATRLVLRLPTHHVCHLTPCFMICGDKSWFALV
mmetsp:Transcript_55770/g.116679  ORF Transcript_55770/g.116679 Transcript_55770/m.116679 type:complete len:407 (+) Transcript_55770:1051-2271(+)